MYLIPDVLCIYWGLYDLPVAAFNPPPPATSLPNSTDPSPFFTKKTSLSLEITRRHINKAILISFKISTKSVVSSESALHQGSYPYSLLRHTCLQGVNLTGLVPVQLTWAFQKLSMWRDSTKCSCIYLPTYSVLILRYIRPMLKLLWYGVSGRSFVKPEHQDPRCGARITKQMQFIATTKQTITRDETINDAGVSLLLRSRKTVYSPTTKHFVT